MEDHNVTSQITPSSEALTEQQLLLEIREQNRQLVHYVRSLNSIVTLAAIFVLLAIAGACALWFLNLL
jgi:uncharacterized phage infection (PIP) family protein YhgE